MTTKIKLIGIDLAKNIFWVRAEDDLGRAVVNRKVGRKELFELVVKAKPELVAMEVCGGAHSWGRKFEAQGLKVMLIPPQFVRPFRQGDKNDRNDTRAICEASRRPDLHPVRVKGIEHQDWQLMISERAALVARRTEIVNRLRGALLEYDFVFSAGVAKLLTGIKELLGREERGLTLTLENKINDDLEDISRLNERIKKFDRKLEEISKTDPICKSISEVRGIGKVTAVAIRAAVVNPLDYRNGRQLSASWGLVPRQCSSGGKDRLLGIGKDGNRYIRQLLIHGARSCILNAHRYDDSVSVWAKRRIGTITTHF